MASYGDPVASSGAPDQFGRGDAKLFLDVRPESPPREMVPPLPAVDGHPTNSETRAKLLLGQPQIGAASRDGIS